jgi:hypothetical protein
MCPRRFRLRLGFGGQVLLLLLVICPAAERVDAQRDEGFTLAVVRRDAIAIPFATYDGKRWKDAWPGPESRVTAPISLSDIPKRWWTGREPVMKWTFWPIHGRPTTIETKGTTWFPTHCHQSLGLRTSYATLAPVPPPSVQPYPKDGLAVAGDATIVPIEILNPITSTVARELERTLAEPIFSEENKLVKSYERRSWSHGYTEEERRATPVRIEALYHVAHGLGDRDVYYFEGVKHYVVKSAVPDSTRRRTDSAASLPPAATLATGDEANRASAGEPDPLGDSARILLDHATPAPPLRAPAGIQQQSASAAPGSQSADSSRNTPPAPCDLVTFVSGWFTRRGDEKISPLQMNVVVTSCDFASAFIMLPLGVAHVEGKPLWIVQWSGWTHERYTVLEVQADRVVTISWKNGGHCLRS